MHVIVMPEFEPRNKQIKVSVIKVAYLYDFPLIYLTYQYRNLREHGGKLGKFGRA